MTTMQKHAMALGYFALAVFCVSTGSQGLLAFRTPLLLGAALSLGAGCVFLASACYGPLCAAIEWLTGMSRLAQEPPARQRANSAEGAR
ncbi:hypothetical protein [Planctomyces sp. SH-PL14]|uniref:hypothetical protein n=1 Tax=Planctomyces sp. SH-PL14 TaxID=1632864 RepID=UPI00078DC135|nr:hypothetical protein [Planctomyces sp. SH-PL14]AMV20322.1 hypothetical protein VT03_20660 [Planctomyces sp. SH-PL14]